jgi:hypothetical protein
VKSHRHIMVGAVAAALPDIMLAMFGWRSTWLDEAHPLVRLHRAAHDPRNLWVVFGIGWATHVIIDQFCRHRTEDDR